MITSNALLKISLPFLLLVIAPASIGWRAGRRGRGRRLVRVLAAISLLAAIAGVAGLVAGPTYASNVTTPPGNDFAYGRALYTIASVVLLGVSVLLTSTACGASLAQTRAERRRMWLSELLVVSAFPLVLAMSFLVADLLRAEQTGRFFLGTCVFSSCATLGIAAYALFGIEWARLGKHAPPLP